MSERGGIINGLAQQSQSKTPHSLAQLTITWIMNMNEHAMNMNTYHYFCFAEQNLLDVYNHALAVFQVNLQLEDVLAVGQIELDEAAQRA